MQNIIQVRLRESGQVLCFVSDKCRSKSGDCVIVEAERGLDYGQVISEEGVALSDKSEEPLKNVLRIALPLDIKQIEQNKQKAKEAFSSAVKKIEEHKLEMKLVEAEYSFDKSKLIFYFTAEGRIDFRELVKDLARVFKTRIELRQIGVRDEAKFLGGFGPCGRQLCCARFLKEFEPVTIRMAKEQNLSLNPSKISGLCGRLMCCLSYEYRTYRELSKSLPKEGDKVTTPEGKGKVLSVNILKGTALIELEDLRQISICCRTCDKHG